MFLSSLTGSAYASTITEPTLSKYTYITTLDYVGQNIAPAGWTFQDIVDRHDTLVAGSINNYTIIHVWKRSTSYDMDSVKTGVTLYSYIIRVPKSYGTYLKDWTLQRQGGRIFVYSFKEGQLKSYDSISNAGSGYNWSTYTPTNQGITVSSRVVNGVFDITAYWEIKGLYDPNNPPPFAYPEHRDTETDIRDLPDVGAPDSDFPVQPSPPDNAWDLIGWLKYIVDWIIYLVKCLVYFIKSLGNAIADVFKGSSTLITALGQIFSFLPNQITALITLGVLALIVVGLIRK